MRWLKLLIAKLFGYNIPVRMIRTRGKTHTILNDLGKITKIKEGTTRMFDVFVENTKLPVPPHDCYLGEEVQVASSEKGKYQYVKFNVDAETIDGIEQDIRFWEENEIMYERNRIKDDASFFQKHGVTIMVGIICFIMVICMVIWVQQVIIPITETAKGIGTTSVMCNWTGMPQTIPQAVPPV